ncbi:MAG: MFS transporter [Gammaproteobacteria bacterium]|nr:MFS transporter [Gammaproteobacteria bacterium]
MKFASLPAITAARLMFSFGFGFFLSMFTRTVSNIVKQPIQLELGLNEEAISLALGTSFFVTFALAQLPLGILLDRYDPRKVNASLFLVAAAGAVVMALSADGAMLSLGRILMGLGFAAGMMGSLKVYSLWFPRERLPTINSLQFMIGVLGAWSATKPTELLLRVLDWRDLYLLFAGVTLLAAAIMVTVAPRHQAPASGETLGDQLRGLLAIYTDDYFWRIAPWMCVSIGVAQGLNTLYIFSWLTDVAAFSVSIAASGVALVTLVSALNFAVLGPLAEKLGKRGFGPLTLPIVGQLLAMLLLVLLALQVKVGVVSQWMVWTMMAGTTTLAFAALSQAFPGHMIGRAYTAFNLLGFLATAAVQWLVGFTLDMFPRAELGGAAPEGYRLAFFVLVACQLAAACWFALATRLTIGSRTMLEKNTDEARAR